MLALQPSVDSRLQSVQSAEDVNDVGFSAAAEIDLFFDIVEILGNEGINANLIRVSVGSPAISDEFSYILLPIRKFVYFV